MKALVVGVQPSESGVIVSLKTEYGLLSGGWDGTLPAMNETVHVELEFDADEVRPSPQHSFTVSSPTPKVVSLTGIVESYHEGLLDLRLGTSLVTVETANPPPIGSWVVVRGSHLTFFDTNL